MKHDVFTDRAACADSLDGAIGACIAELPEIELDTEMSARLMAGVMGKAAPKRRSAVRSFAARTVHAVSAPMTITLRPWQLAPLMAASVLLAFMALSGPMRPGGFAVGQEGQIQQASVRFSLDLDRAGSVALVGSFNDWSPEGYAMEYDATSGLWTLNVPLASGRHSYGFLVDGKRILADPKAHMFADDGFGNRNSVLILDEEVDHVST